ncbi:MAG: hypothetical protein PVF27_03255 [Gemmatimonadales bacterium]|jgi:hypothetical protein
MRTLAVVLALLTAGCDAPLFPDHCSSKIAGYCWSSVGPDLPHITAIAVSARQAFVGTDGSGVFRFLRGTTRWELTSPAWEVADLVLVDRRHELFVAIGTVAPPRGTIADASKSILSQSEWPDVLGSS